MLISKDGQETKTDDYSTSDIALLLLVLDITDSSRGQEDNGKDSQDADPDRGTILAETGEGLEEVDDSREHDPTVP